jgi:hypothetical protein
MKILLNKGYGAFTITKFMRKEMALMGSDLLANHPDNYVSDDITDEVRRDKALISLVQEVIANTVVPDYVKKSWIGDIQVAKFSCTDEELKHLKIEDYDGFERVVIVKVLA